MPFILSDVSWFGIHVHTCSLVEHVASVPKWFAINQMSGALSSIDVARTIILHAAYGTLPLPGEVLGHDVTIATMSIMVGISAATSPCCCTLDW